MIGAVDGRVRRGAGTAVALLAWVGFVALAVLQGRGLRDTDPGTGSWALLVLWSLGAVAGLYVALVQLLRARAAADATAASRRRPPPRHRA